MNGEMFRECIVEDDKLRRYTTADFMKWIKEKAGVDAWDVDVAADEESHHAPRWFSVKHYAGSAGVDGLAQSWLPEECVCETDDTIHFKHEGVWRIFINPPFDDLGPWFAKVWKTIRWANVHGIELRIAFVLPGDRHEQPFWHEHVEPYRFEVLRGPHLGYELTLHHPKGRVAYAKPGSRGLPVGEAFFPSALLVWRRA